MAAGSVLLGDACLGGDGPPAAQAPAADALTLDVLRGTSAVLKADGTPLSPAPSGMVGGQSDQKVQGNRTGTGITGAGAATNGKRDISLEGGASN